MDARRYARTWLTLPVEYSTNSSRHQIGHTSNLSLGGAMLTLHERLDVGQSFDVAIFVSLGTKVETIALDFTGVWMDGAAQEGAFSYGARFVGPSETDRETLTRVFDELNADQPACGIAVERAESWVSAKRRSSQLTCEGRGTDVSCFGR
jgi:hypothetical protein